MFLTEIFPRYSQLYLSSLSGKIFDFDIIEILRNSKTTFVKDNYPEMEYQNIVKSNPEKLLKELENLRSEYYLYSEKYKQYLFYEKIDTYNFYYEKFFKLNPLERLLYDYYNPISQAALYYFIKSLSSDLEVTDSEVSATYDGGDLEFPDFNHLSKIYFNKYFSTYYRDIDFIENFTHRMGREDLLVIEGDILFFTIYKPTIESVLDRGNFIIGCKDNRITTLLFPNYSFYELNGYYLICSF